MTRRLRRARFDVKPPWRISTSPPARTCPPRRSATSPRRAGSTVEYPSSCRARSGGKTHAAQAVGHLAIRHGAEVRFYKTSRALAHLPADTPTASGAGTWPSSSHRRAHPGRLLHAQAHPATGRPPDAALRAGRRQYSLHTRIGPDTTTSQVSPTNGVRNRLKSYHRHQLTGWQPASAAVSTRSAKSASSSPPEAA
jgi:hypothetical protein